MFESGAAPSSSEDRRSHPRDAVSDPVKLVARSGQVFEALAVDRSLRGLRVQLSQAAILPTDVTVLSRSAGAVYLARIVWRTPPYAGLSISRTVDMRTASGPDTNEFRRLWREHIAR